MRFFLDWCAEWTKVSFSIQQCCRYQAYNVMKHLWSPLIADTFCRPPPPMGFPTLAYGLGDSTLRRKIPRVHLVPLNVGYEALQAMRAWYASAEGQRQYAH